MARIVLLRVYVSSKTSFGRNASSSDHKGMAGIPPACNRLLYSVEFETRSGKNIGQVPSGRSARSGRTPSTWSSCSRRNRKFLRRPLITSSLRKNFLFLLEQLDQ